MKKIFVCFIMFLLLFSFVACNKDESIPENSGQENLKLEESESKNSGAEESIMSEETKQMIPDTFVLIPGGSFEMGSNEIEAWRSNDETLHSVSVDDFYMSSFEVTGEEYAQFSDANPSNIKGNGLPVENVSWLDAIRYCNARSEAESRVPVYTIEGTKVSWNRSANGYRLPTEAEWEYACRAGTQTPFNTENSVSAEEANYYGHYPYEIEDNYFDQGNLSTKPGQYRQTTVAVDSFSPNAFGLYNMHGNVGEWVWDWYGDYETSQQLNPTGPSHGTLKVYRGGAEEHYKIVPSEV